MIRLIESRVPKCLAVEKMSAGQLAQALRCFARRIPRPMCSFALTSEDKTGSDSCAVYSNDEMVVSFGSYGGCDSVFRALFFILTAQHVEMICDALELSCGHVDPPQAERSKEKASDDESTAADNFQPGIIHGRTDQAGGDFRPWIIPSDREASGEGQI